MAETFEILITDLKPRVQEKLREFLGLEEGENGHYDVFPLASIPKPEPEEG